MSGTCCHLCGYTFVPLLNAIFQVSQEKRKDKMLPNPRVAQHVVESCLIESVVIDEIYNHQGKDQESIEANAEQRKRAPKKMTRKPIDLRCKYD